MTGPRQRAQAQRGDLQAHRRVLLSGCQIQATIVLANDAKVSTRKVLGMARTRRPRGNTAPVAAADLETTLVSFLRLKFGQFVPDVREMHAAGKRRKGNPLPAHTLQRRARQTRIRVAAVPSCLGCMRKPWLRETIRFRVTVNVRASVKSSKRLPTYNIAGMICFCERCLAGLALPALLT